MKKNDLKPTHHPQPTSDEIAAIVKEKLLVGEIIDERDAKIIWLYRNKLVDTPQFKIVQPHST